MIGNKIGYVHHESVNRRSILANRYLRFRVEVEVNKPILAGFFQRDKITGFNSSLKDYQTFATNANFSNM